MIAEAQSDALKDELTWFIENARSRPVRTISEFAEQELILPYDGGPHEGERFRFEFQPFTRLLLREIDSGRWSEFVITGPSQSGKTLICFVLPVVYTVAELRRNIVVGVPDKEMAGDKWKVDIEPVFRASPMLASLLPTSGEGSKGGRVRESVILNNGVVIKFMAPGGDDANKAGFTASTVVVTEAARFSDPAHTSVEADPLRQLKARQRSLSRFTPDGQLNTFRRLFVEGTVTVEEELPWKAQPSSSQSRIVCPCPHCSQWVSPERQHLAGWDDAVSELDAAEHAFFGCPACGEQLTDEHRSDMNRNAMLIHAGQSVVGGKVQGDPPRTSRLWFRWNAWNNLFTSTADLGAEEWSSRQFPEDTSERTNAEKDLSQSIWCMPYQPLNLEGVPLSVDAVSERSGGLGWNVVPHDTQWLTVGVDIGKYICWWFAIAFRADGRLWCPAYGSRVTGLRQDAVVSDHHEAEAVYACVDRISQTLERGFQVEDAKDVRLPDRVGVDSGYLPDVVFAFCRSKGSGPRSRYMPVRGQGKSQLEARRYMRPARVSGDVRRVGNGWHLVYERSRPGWRVMIDADQSKMDVQACLRVAKENPGALELAEAPTPDMHAKVCRHLSSEVRRTVIDPATRKIKEEWVQTGQNHWLDCAGYAIAMGRVCGWNFRQQRATDSETQEKEPKPKARGWMARAKEARK